MKFLAIRYHDISAGHRIYGHKASDGSPGKCSHLHGHGYRITFYCEAPELDDLGMVVDFGIIKSTLCNWLDLNFDHKFLVWQTDPLSHALKILDDTVVLLPFNPTAENIGAYLLNNIGPELLVGSAVKLVKVLVEETRKCAAEVSL